VRKTLDTTQANGLANPWTGRSTADSRDRGLSQDAEHVIFDGAKISYVIESAA
jgi:hypothetical protein